MTTFSGPTDISDVQVPDELRPRVARQLGLPLKWDVAIDALPSPSLTDGRGWFVLLCRLYRRVRPRSVGNRCAFEPSCSRYAEIAFRAFGAKTGLKLTLGRLKRCRANNGGVDLPASLCSCSEAIKGMANEV